MPELCRFAGIVVSMFPGDHNPPHFHASYSGHRVCVDVSSLEVSRGYMPISQLHVLLEWAESHQSELVAAWNAIRSGGKAEKIQP